MSPSTEHLTIDELADYCEGTLSDADREDAHWHLATCSDCTRTLVEYREGLASVTGFDPLTGDRYHLDGEVVITGIDGLHAVRKSHGAVVDAVPQAADARVLGFPSQVPVKAHAGNSIQIGSDDNKVTVDLALAPNTGTLKARATDRRGPVSNVEVRIELRGYEDSDRGFELYAWGVTNDTGFVDLGAVRRVDPAFDTGYRFVLGVVIPGLDA